MNIERDELFDKQFQERLLAHCVRHPKLLDLIWKGRVSPSDFDFAVARAIVVALQEILRVQGGIGEGIAYSVLTAQLRAMVNLGKIFATEVQALSLLIATIYSCEMAPDYFYGMVSQFISHQRFHQELDKTNIGNFSDLGDKLQRIKLDSVIEKEEAYFPLMDFTAPEQVICVPTGIPGIDEGMDGGLPLNEYGLVCAYTGVGKTMLAVNFVWGGANNGFQTRIATLELPKGKIAQRIWSNVGRYDYKLIRSGDPTGVKPYSEILAEVQQRVQENAQGRERNIQVWDFSREACTTQKLADWIHRDQDNNPDKPPQMLFVDWLLCLDEGPNFDTKKLNNREVRHKVQKISEELSRLALQEKMAIWAATQGDAKSEGKDKVTMANAAEAKSSGWRCYAFLGIGASDANRENNIFTAHASKMRDGRLFTCRLASELHQCRFVDYVDQDPGEQAISSAMQDQIAAVARRNGSVVGGAAALNA